ncbi:Aldehyde dehydrogenase family protein [Rhodococcus rhodochrous J3]|uniref:Aldehyde dehydrogenase n=2 Tax=Rhodococcus rhodochrous TaxID=1829 RepID=A0AA47A5M3_RHORH|nr:MULTISPECIES: aldehyde dehydrogenase [Rhodococcus]MBF4480208.1 aldehyde dehydrogenase [Rhodococcus rhodochrous]MCB8910659.1 aldehyde dehydrogenase [Rhodococcus rhodochrous]MDC3724286.1 aldehyde dehydrogenase [Rhodococcus sp. Rp3]MDJ0399092.1 aldehyde dehydrogenase [Rhodococcus rhodochrous]TWH62126.1 acyl-CoA reductase-like NAD-dependent aldehyde dehydrogenase [Rhodococcus rhodochrous J38]
MTTAIPIRLKSYDKLFIGGSWVEPSSDAVIDVISPITEEVIASVPEAREADMDRAVAAARKAFDEGPWPRMTPAERAEILVRVGDEVKKRIPAMAEAFTLELGGPAAISTLFHQNAVDMWDDAATFHERFVFEEERTWKDGRGKVVREPIGVVAVVVPWNGPVATASLKISPALAAGCTVILKPAPEGPVTTMMLAEALEAAGLPEGVISVLPAGREVGDYLVGHPDVDKISFTGSTVAGRTVMTRAAEKIKRVTLELGGKSAAIIADDIELDSFLPGMVFGGIGHSGQVCAALTRVLVPRDRQDEVVAAIEEVMKSVKVGDPRDPDTFIGPLAAQRQQKRVLEYIEVGKEEGARLVVGGGRPAHLDRGWYVEPTLFADVRNDMRIAQEEIFGPVLVVIPFDSIDEAIAIANDSDYGLSGAVYAKDRALADSVARRVRTGQISVNGYAMCVVQPFGGYKQSGLGREGGVEGFDAFFETKLIQEF